MNSSDGIHRYSGQKFYTLYSIGVVIHLDAFSLLERARTLLQYYVLRRYYVYKGVQYMEIIQYVLRPQTPSGGSILGCRLSRQQHNDEHIKCTRVAMLL